MIGDFPSNLTNSLTPKRDTSNGIIRVFPKIDDSGSVDNKGLLREEQNKFSKKLPPLGIEPETLGFLWWHILCYILMSSSPSQHDIACKTETFGILI